MEPHDNTLIRRNDMSDGTKAMKACDVVMAAKAELDKERMDSYKEAVKRKLSALAQAKKIVNNLEKELLDLEIQMSEEL